MIELVGGPLCGKVINSRSTNVRKFADFHHLSNGDVWEVFYFENSECRTALGNRRFDYSHQCKLEARPIRNPPVNPGRGGS